AHGDSCDLRRSLYRSVEKNVKHAERPRRRAATVEIHRNVFRIVDSRKERFSLFERCGKRSEAGGVLGDAGSVFQRDTDCPYTALAGGIREPYSGVFAALGGPHQFGDTSRAKCDVTF